MATRLAGQGLCLSCGAETNYLEGLEATTRTKQQVETEVTLKDEWRGRPRSTLSSPSSSDTNLVLIYRDWPKVLQAAVVPLFKPVLNHCMRWWEEP